MPVFPQAKFSREGILYEDWIDGDFSGEGLAPWALPLNLGSNAIRGAVSGALSDVGVDDDYITLTVPEGTVLDSIVMGGYSPTVEGISIPSSSTALYVQEGPVFDAEETLDLLGAIYLRAGDIQSDILDNLGASYGNFDSDLPAGEYSFALYEPYGPAYYELDFITTLVSDIDSDGDVDTADLTRMLQNYTGDVGAAGGLSRAQGDTDFDGDVDTADLTLALQQFTGEGVVSLTAQPVPEPGGLLLAALGLAGLVVVGRRRMAPAGTGR